MPSRARTALVALIVTAALTSGALIGIAGAAQAAAYRYWTYWQGGTGTWAFATAGPASLVPEEGSVEGWRFAVTTTAGAATDAPQTVPDFDAICGTTAAEPDRKRVALVVDPGSPAIAPEGQTPPVPITTCVVAEMDATGYQVLRTAAVVRTDQGLICGIADYPTGECAPVVEDLAPVASPSASATASPESTAMDLLAAAPASSSSGAPWLTIAVVALLAVVGLVLWRRRRHD